MNRRRKLDRSDSRRMFSRGASRTHRKNLAPVSGPMRGGIRL